MPNTPVLGLPYPQASDTADVPRDMQALAVKLDAVVPAQAGKTAVVSSLVGDVGLVGQVRAGRQLAVSDFTVLGLSTPRGLWNLSDLTDVSGNARNLTNKGGVSFSPGINGLSATAAQFAGSTAQALYIADTGAADPFRIATGSWGCWFRTAKTGLISQRLMAKIAPAAAASDVWFDLTVNPTSGVVGAQAFAGAIVNTSGVSAVWDDRWHFAVATYDGTAMRLYVDGVLETTASGGGPITATGIAPLNIGAYGADAGVAAASPHFGRVDEAFVTNDVLTEDQVRSLYAARLVHTLGAQPKTVSLSVRRQRRGAALATTDFSTTPLRLHNFTAASLADQGSNATALTVAAGTPVGVAGADGVLGSGYSFNGSSSLAATDAGLPSALLARSYGCWLKCSGNVNAGALGWGTTNTADARLMVIGGGIQTQSAGDGISGPYVADGQWHFAVVVEDNTAGDGVKRKLYSDGRIVNGSTVLNSITLAGANRFRTGSNPDGTSPFTGQIDGAFVTGYAMTTDEVLRLYAKASQAMPSSPKNAGDSVEAYDSGSLLVVCDTLEAQHYVDFTVA